MWLKQLFLDLEYDSRTQIFAYFVLSSMEESFLVFFLSMLSPILSSYLFCAYEHFNMCGWNYFTTGQLKNSENHLALLL